MIGAIERFRLPPVLDAAAIARLGAQLQECARPELRLLVFEGQGKHFSFGASVPEHLPGEVEQMLPAFHRLFGQIEDLGVPTAAIVRGQCLGGGCELALWCGFVAASPEAKLGLPEVTLGVFPPVAALALRWRVGGSVATRLITTGARIDAVEALRIGLVDEVAADPEVAVQAWFDQHLADRSALGVRYAWKAARRPIAALLEHELPALEQLYLDDLMTRRDPVEGLTAFLEKRAPQWSHA